MPGHAAGDKGPEGTTEVKGGGVCTLEAPSAERWGIWLEIRTALGISRGYIPGRGAGGLAQVYGEGSEEGLEGKGDGDVEGVRASA